MKDHSNHRSYYSASEVGDQLQKKKNIRRGKLFFGAALISSEQLLPPGAEM
jgi:hypothetical protein